MSLPLHSRWGPQEQEHRHTPKKSIRRKRRSFPVPGFLRTVTRNSCLRRNGLGFRRLPDERAQDLPVFALEAEVLGKFLVAHREQAREVRDLLLHEEIDV